MLGTAACHRRARSTSRSGNAGSWHHICKEGHTHRARLHGTRVRSSSMPRRAGSKAARATRRAARASSPGPRGRHAHANVPAPLPDTTSWENVLQSYRSYNQRLT
jgi:hypothetical protein